MYRTTPIFWKNPINIYIYISLCLFYLFLLLFAIIIDSHSHSYCCSCCCLLLYCSLFFLPISGGWRFLFTLKYPALNIYLKRKKEIDLRPDLAVTVFPLKKKEDIWINPHNKFTIMYISKRYYYYYKELISRIIYWRILTEKQNLQFHLRSVRTNWIL